MCNVLLPIHDQKKKEKKKKEKRAQQKKEERDSLSVSPSLIDGLKTLFVIRNTRTTDVKTR